MWSYHLQICSISFIVAKGSFLPFGSTTEQVELHGPLHPGRFDDLLRRFRLQLHRLSDLEAMIHSSLQRSIRPKEFSNEFGNGARRCKAYKTMFLLVCCSLLILHEGDIFFNGLWSKSAPSQEALARYPDPPRAMEMDSSATRAPQASASPMAGSTCCTHSR